MNKAILVLIFAIALISSVSACISCPPSCDYECFVPNTISLTETLGNSGETTLENILINYGYSDFQDKQINIQYWDVDEDVELTIEYIGGISAYNQVFGYYLDHDLSTFTPIFTRLSSDIGDTFTINVDAGEEIGFAIKVLSDGVAIPKYASENDLNPGDEDRLITFDLCDEFLLGFEDLGHPDSDYQDLVVSITRTECGGDEPEPVCGNDIIEDGEECDDGIYNGFLCWAGYDQYCEYCSINCKIKTLWGPYCGDGFVQSCEECDDGNNEDGDGCSSECVIEEVPQSCGNGIIETGEECDEGILNGILCEAGYDDYCEYCSNSCVWLRIDGPYCGDHIINGEEECDGGENCNNDCEIEETPEDPICGNNIVETGEQCDLGDNNGVKCDNSESDCTYCSNSCQWVQLKEKCSSCKGSGSTTEFISYCEPNWNCGAWSECNDGVKSRTCYDTNNCDYSYGKPGETTSCELNAVQLAPETEDQFQLPIIFWVLAALVIIAIIVIIVNVL